MTAAAAAIATGTFFEKLIATSIASRVALDYLGVSPAFDLRNRFDEEKMRRKGRVGRAAGHGNTMGQQQGCYGMSLSSLSRSRA